MASEDSFPPLADLVIPTEWQHAHDELMREVRTANPVVSTTTTTTPMKTTTKPTKSSTTKDAGYYYHDPNYEPRRRTSFPSSLLHSTLTTTRQITYDDGDDDDMQFLQHTSTSTTNNNKAHTTGPDVPTYHLPTYNNKAYGGVGDKTTNFNHGSNRHHYPTNQRHNDNDDDEMMDIIMDRPNLPADPPKTTTTTKRTTTTTKSKSKVGKIQVPKPTKASGNSYYYHHSSKYSDNNNANAGESVQSPTCPMEEWDNVFSNHRHVVVDNKNSSSGGGGNNNYNSRSNDNNNGHFFSVPNVVNMVTNPPAGLDVMDLHGEYYHDDLLDDDGDDDDLFYDPSSSFSYAGQYFSPSNFGGGTIPHASSSSSSGPTGGLHNTSTLDGMLAVVADAMDYTTDDYVMDDMDPMTAGTVSTSATTATTMASMGGTSQPLTTSHKVIAGLPYQERYKATFEKLQASLKRSEETRKCLSIQTVQTQQYDRLASVDGVLSSIMASSSQLQKVVAKTNPGSPIPQRQMI